MRAGSYRLLAALAILATGCLPPPPQPGAPGAVWIEGAPATPDTLGAKTPALTPDSLAVADTLAPADTLRAPEPARAPPDTSALPPAPPEPWFMHGASLTGSLDGPTTVEQIRIRHGPLRVRAREGIWNSDLERADLHGQVMIEDTTRTMHGDHGRYYRNTALLEMDGHVSGTGEEGRFTCQSLRYQREQRLLYLMGAVRLSEEGRTMHAHWLEYDIADSFITAGGALRLNDPADSVMIRGDSLFYDRRSGLAIIVGGPSGERPSLTRTATTAEPPFVVYADSLLLRLDERIGVARGEVDFSRGAMVGVCDEVQFEMSEDRLQLIGAPRVDDPEGWVAGDSMAVDLRSGLADRLLVWGNARGEYQPPGRPGEAHFTRGDSLSAFLEDGYIRNVLVEGGAQTLYVPSARDAAAEVGLNFTQATRLRLVMQAVGVERIQFEGAVAGKYILPAGGKTDSSGAGDSLGAPPSLDPYEIIRSMSRRGDLTPSDSLVVALGFNPAETVSYKGDQIDYAVGSDLMMIKGNGWVGYQGMELFAGEIDFDSARELVTARQSPILKDETNEVHGDEMTYRIDSRNGLVFQGRGEFDGGYFRGERVKRTPDSILFAQEGDFTTCDQDTTHFHFHAKRMKILSGDKALARPVVLYIGNIPILAIPYAVFPIRRGRQSGLLVPEFEFGIDSDRGRFLRNVGYYVAGSDYWDALFWMDYYEENPKLTFNAWTRYKKRYSYSGRVEGSFTRQEAVTGAKKDGWLFKLTHDQTLGERFTLKASADFRSDKEYASERDFGASVDERLNRVLHSQFSLAKSWSGASLNLSADRKQYLDESGGSTRISQSLPSVNFNLSSIPLGTQPDSRGRGGRLPLLASTYFQTGGRYRSIYTRTWADSTYTNQAIGMDATLSDKRRLLGVVNITPSAKFTTAWAYKNKLAEVVNRTGLTWRAGLSASTSVFGTFAPQLGAWEGLRHVLEFGTSYGYAPENNSVKDFPSVAGIGLSSAKSSSMSLRMTQRFHLKLKDGEKVRKLQNFLVWSANSSYNFLAKENAQRTYGDNYREYYHPWADVSHSLDLKPGGLFASHFSLTHDLENWERKRLSLRTGLNLRGGRGGGGVAPAGQGGFGDIGESESGPDVGVSAHPAAGPWSLSLTHNFSMQKEWSSHSSALNLGSEMGLTRAWRLRYSIYYDLTDQKVNSTSYSLTRDLHCWRMAFERRSSVGHSSYYFRINVNDLPDLKYERTRR